MRRIWAAAERVIPRGVVAATTLVAAAATDPHSIGVYTWAVLALTFFGTLTDLPMRQISVQFLGSSGNLHTMRRSALVAGAAGLVFMVGATGVISLLIGGDSTLGTFGSLIALALIPPAQAGAVESTAILQKTGRWGAVSVARAIGSLVGTAIGIPIILATGSIAGACVAVAASEIGYTLIVRHRACDVTESKVGRGAGDEGGGGIGYWASYRHMALYGAVGWLQGNADRWLMGIWAGTSVLGTYSLGSAIGRSAGEAIAISQVNVLRVELAHAGANSDSEIRKVFGRNLRTEIIFMLISSTATVFLSAFVLTRFLGPEWSEAFQIVPILVLTAIPLAVATSSVPVHLQRGNSRIAFVAPATCLLFAPAVAFAAMTSLKMAAWIYLARECVLALIQCALTGRAAPWREVVFAVMAVAVGSGAVLAFS